MASNYNKKALLGELGIEDDPTNPLAPAMAAGAMSPGSGVDILKGLGGQYGGSASIAPGEGSPNAGPAPVLDQPLATMPTMADAPAAPDYTKVGKYALTGYDAAKMAMPWDQKSEKYKIGTIQSNFDPKGGYSPEMLKALNDANIYGAKFSGSGDKLGVDNAGGYDRFGKGGTADAIKGFHSDNPEWSPWFVDDGANGQAPPQGGGMQGIPAFGGEALPADLSGDPLAKIRAAIEAMSGSRPNAAALMQQLGGGR